MDADVLYHERIMAALAAGHRPVNRMLMDREFEAGDEPVKLCMRDGVAIELRKQVARDLRYDTIGESVGFFRSTKPAHVDSPASWPTTSMAGAPIYRTKRRYAICCGNPAKSSKSSTSRERPGSRSTFPLTWSVRRARYFRNCDGCQESARFDRRAGTLERCFGFPVHRVATRRRRAVDGGAVDRPRAVAASGIGRPAISRAALGTSASAWADHGSGALAQSLDRAVHSRAGSRDGSQ